MLNSSLSKRLLSLLMRRLFSSYSFFSSSTLVKVPTLLHLDILKLLEFARNSLRSLIKVKWGRSFRCRPSLSPLSCSSPYSSTVRNCLYPGLPFVLCFRLFRLCLRMSPGNLVSVFCLFRLPVEELLLRLCYTMSYLVLLLSVCGGTLLAELKRTLGRSSCY